MVVRKEGSDNGGTGVTPNSSFLFEGATLREAAEDSQRV